MPLKRVLLAVLVVAHAASAAAHRFALIAGIDDYSASRLTTIREAAPGRDWPNLSGAVNDAEAMRELLVVLRGFDARDIDLLENQAATRAAILDAANRLVVRAAKNDVVFFYFAGHGSQVNNSRSDEPDKLDESIVPADSRRGAYDIRDKELRRIFNAILDRGARLTVMIDACHSGSGARGTRLPVRGIKPDLRDVIDGGPFGPRPENRGAIVISASHDEEEAREIRDDRKTMHGAFTWAWMRAMRDAASDEPVGETFARAQARLRAEMPFQNPVLAGNARDRDAPFLGTRAGIPHATFAIERVHDGVATVAGGWAHGITVGTALRVDRAQPPLVVTALLGLGRCEARVPPTTHVRGGMLVAIAGWAAPPPRPLRVAIPRDAAGVAAQFANTPLIEIVENVDAADYVLARRGTRYAWIRVTGARLPRRTAWSRNPSVLRERALRLQKIIAWNLIEPPPGPRWPYHLVLRGEGVVGDGGRVMGGERYALELRAGSRRTMRRHVYVFTIDSAGRSTLLFPVSGSVENHFPIAGETLIPLNVTVTIAPPYGIDTYVLLSSDDPLPNPWVLQWDGVRAATSLVPGTWSIERIAIESVRPRHKRAAAVSLPRATSS